MERLCCQHTFLASFKTLLNKNRWSAHSKAADAFAWIDKLLIMCMVSPAISSCMTYPYIDHILPGTGST